MAKKKKEEAPQLPPIEITAAGATEGQKELNRSMCQAAPGWPTTLILLADAIVKRAENVMMDYTRDRVSVRYKIDGVWHDLPPQDRQTGDAMLAVVKKLCNLNPDDRRGRQEGKFGAEFLKKKYICNLTSQGVQTGERAALEVAAKDKEKEEPQKLADIGMRDKMIETYKELINADSGLILVSAVPKQGLPTLWRVSLNTTDRFMRDFISLEDQDKPEDEVINITPNYYNAAANETPATILPKLLLKQPDVLVMPNLTDGETVNMVSEQVNDAGKLVIARIPAKNAAEALLRVLALKSKREVFARAVKAVVNQRVFRKLCEECKQPYAPQPQMLQKLGIPPGRVQAFYREYQPPPPQVDEKGNPITPQICSKCAGIGYHGRAGLFELLVVNDAIRQVLVKQPQLAAIQAAAKKAGNRTFQEEGILAVCLGTTSLKEVQRALQQ